MAEITVLNEKFESVGTIDSPVSLSADVINVPVVHQVVKATLAGRRQGSASTKTRGLVRGGGAKPYKQKGTGRARQGSKRSPLLVGGGTIFGPTPRDYSQKVNTKVAKKAIHSVVVDKLQAGKLHVFEKLNSSGKTKEMFQLLSERNLLPALVVAAEIDSPAILASRNLRQGFGLWVDDFEVYEALKYENLIIEKEALKALLNLVGGGKV